MPEIKDLTNLEIVEDIEYYLLETQMMSPSFTDGRFEIIKRYVKELKERFGE